MNQKTEQKVKLLLLKNNLGMKAELESYGIDIGVEDESPNYSEN